MTNIVAKSFQEMTLPELRHELVTWEAWVTVMTGGTLALVIECRDQCLAWVGQREREVCHPRVLQ